jgi:hypothetical protein
MGNRAAGWWRSPVVLTVGVVIAADALSHGAGLGVKKHGRRAPDRDAAFPALRSIDILRQQLDRSLGDCRGASLRRLALRRWLGEHPTFAEWHPTP